MKALPKLPVPPVTNILEEELNATINSQVIKNVRPVKDGVLYHGG